MGHSRFWESVEGQKRSPGPRSPGRVLAGEGIREWAAVFAAALGKDEDSRDAGP